MIASNSPSVYRPQVGARGAAPGAGTDLVGGVKVPAGRVPPAGAVAFPGFGAR
jgi:hypothetical protein